MIRLRRFICAVSFLLISGAQAWALPTTSVVISNDGLPLLDTDGATALSAGSDADGDGAIVAMGYFTGSTESAGFSGTWVPLSGPAAHNKDLAPATIGDSGSNASGPYGFVNAQLDFDAENLDTFEDTPGAGTRLAVAVYNRSTLESSTHFAIATNDAWQWTAPSLFPNLIAIDLAAPGTVWFGGDTDAGTTTQPLANFPGLAPKARLINISTRGAVGTGNAALIPGFVIAGSGTKSVLIRAVGPTLESFGVAGTLDDPTLRVVQSGSPDDLVTNDDWWDQVDSDAVEAARVATGAFPLANGSKDAAALATLSGGGQYTALVTGKDGGTGIAIAEAYVVNDAETPDARIVNVSTRGYVGSGDSVLIPGIVVGAGGPRRLLIRAAGPTLGVDPFDIPGVLANPVIRVFSSADGNLIAMNDDWQSDGEGPRLAAAAAQVGAFALVDGSHDAALILTVEANHGYTVQVSGVGGTEGIAIAEIYELP